ncbi:MAG: hypothetical protein ACP5RO_03160 [Fervidicoccaceae archaeon]
MLLKGRFLLKILGLIPECPAVQVIAVVHTYHPNHIAIVPCPSMYCESRYWGWSPADPQGNGDCPRIAKGYGNAEVVIIAPSDVELFAAVLR